MGEPAADYRKLMEEAREASRAHQIHRLDECSREMIALIPEPGAETGAEAVQFFKDLHGDRRYEQIQLLGEAYIKAGYTTPRIWTIYALALIDRGSQVAAIGLLNSLLSLSDDVDLKEEMPEIHGLCGRAWKDIGYEAILAKRRPAAARALAKAYESYARGLNERPEDPSLLAWHGTQRVAVSALAKANDITGIPDETEFAKKILAAVKNTKGPPDPWRVLAAGEMHVALKQLDQAVAEYERAFKMEKVDSFMLASSHRQISQVWRVGNSEVGARLERLLLAEIAKRQNGMLLTGGATRQLQAYVNDGGSVGMTAVKEALRCAGSVAMIMKKFEALGTGFVVHAKDIGLGNLGKVVVTNAHVVSDPPQGDAASHKDVQVKFELQHSNVFKVESVVASLPVDGHDCTVLRLREPIPDSIGALPVGDLPERLEDDLTASVIGHPMGREISFSFSDARLVGFEAFADAAPQHMHYRSATDFGSSGSPVFNKSWDVIGIHRGYNAYCRPLNGAAGTYAANEGISLASIKAAFSAR
jgi:tetratricopeptide (TPR) repeat protein